MVIVSIDAHKQTHTLVAIDEVGRKLGPKVIDAVSSSNADGLRWATVCFSHDVRWVVKTAATSLGGWRPI